jgi:glycosyl transferase family 1/glycosyl transferase family 4
MRILHLDAGREMRGGQWQVLRLLEGLAGAGVETGLLARDGGPLLEMARKRGWNAGPLAATRVFREARRQDLIHAHDARSHTLAAITGGAPLVVARRVAFPVGSGWKYQRARCYIAVSEFVKSVLMAGGVSAEKIEVVHDGVPLLEPASGSAVLAPANAGDPQKGAALAKEAARLAGVNLRFTGDLERDLAGAGLFLYLTHNEGLGSAALLAMSAAVPVIASNVGGLREVIRHGENGLLVENKIEAVAAALRELAGNPEAARRLGRAARQTVQERFTIDIMLRKTIGVYHKVLA